MHRRAGAIATAVVLTGLVVVGLDTYTYAGTGDSLILGKFNKATKTTHVTSTGKGPALSLHAKGKRPALAVDSSARIVRLNADRLDGKHASGLQNNVRVFTATSGSTADGSMEFRLPDLPKGRYQFTYDVSMLDSWGTDANPTSGICWLGKPGASVYAGRTTATSVFTNIGLSGAGVIAQNHGRWLLHCELYQSGVGYKSWSIPAYQPVRVSLTRIDKTIGGGLDIVASARRSDETNTFGTP